MKLVEYLFSDPGSPPTTGLDHDAKPLRGDPIAHLDGGSHRLHLGISPYDAIYYRHVLGEAKAYTVKDSIGNKLPVEVEHDEEKGDYVAVVRGGRFRRMASGNMRQPIREIGTGPTPEAAVKALGKKLRESIGEGKKLEHGAYDNRAIGKLKNGKYPGRAEDGKGFCFVCASGAITAFRWRGDALRWANDEPREITKFWYGEPVAPSGKFRVRVRDRYRKDEGAETFSDLLARRASGVSDLD
jgi:hypothetical protein